MEVILKEEISGLGKAGELVKVKDGFARNFLLPQKKAVAATSKNVQMIEHQKKAMEAGAKKLKKISEEVSLKLAKLSITITREAGVDEKIFGSVTSKDVSDALRAEGIVIDKRSILISEPIKQIGVFDVNVKLHPEVVGVVKIWVVKK